MRGRLKRVALRGLLVVVGVAEAACGGIAERPSSRDAAPTGGAAQAWSDFCDLASATRVARSFACLQVAELAPTTPRLSVCDLAAASIAAGRIRLRPEAMPACLRTVAEVSCDAILGGLVSDFPCPDVLAGTVESGGGCLLDADCADPLRDACVGSDRCHSTCQARLAAGAACDGAPQVACAVGFVCDSSNQCVPLAAWGDGCGPGVGVCGLGLACDAGGVCGKVVAGSACDAFDFLHCGLALRCDSQSATCLPYRFPGEDCTTGACVAGSYCEPGDAAAVCAPSPRLGGSCRVVLQGAEIVEESRCSDGYCDRLPGELAGTCRPWKDVGQPCTRDQECNQDAGRVCHQGRCTMGTCGEAW